MGTYNLFKNTAALQYEYHIEGDIALVEYLLTPKGEVYLTHTEVPPGLQGRGIASQLIEEVLTDIERHGQRVIPVCPFVSTFINRHPEWRRIVGEE